MRLRIGTFVRVEERSGAWTIGHLVAKEPQGITVDDEIAYRPLSRSEIRRVLMEHHHGQWTGIKDVAVGALAGGVIGGLAAPKHRALAATALAAVGAVAGLVLAAMTMILKEVNSASVDEVLVYYKELV